MGSVQLNSTSTGFIQQPVYDLSNAPEQRNSHGQYSPIQSDSAGGFPFIHNPSLYQSKLSRTMQQLVHLNCDICSNKVSMVFYAPDFLTVRSWFLYY